MSHDHAHDRATDTESEAVKERLMAYMSQAPCPACSGKRLRTESLAVKVKSGTLSLSIADLASMTVARALAVELAPLGIRVNTFAPGPVNVERNLRDDPDYRDVWGAMIPLGRTAETEEMVGPALFLASADSSYVTGQTFFVDGGWTVQGMVPASNVKKAARKNR